MHLILVFFIDFSHFHLPFFIAFPLPFQYTVFRIFYIKKRGIPNEQIIQYRQSGDAVSVKNVRSDRAESHFHSELHSHHHDRCFDQRTLLRVPEDAPRRRSLYMAELLEIIPTEFQTEYGCMVAFSCSCCNPWNGFLYY